MRCWFCKCLDFRPFLVCTFSLKKKSPTITVGSFFQLTISLWMVHFSYKSYNFLQFLLSLRSVFLHHLRNSTGPKGTPLEYFRFCETFFEKKILTEGSPSIFWNFSTERMLKNPKGSPLQLFFGTVRLFFRRFLSPNGPPSSFLIFFKKPKGSPLSSFSALWDCFKILVFSIFFQKFFEFVCKRVLTPLKM